jgi:D-3-phosphoglycerate dehydrogenase / 2-oxoglutarate reductase
MNNLFPDKYILFDFDSTFTQVEGLDELANIALRSDPDRLAKVAAIEALTNKGMAGEIPFSVALSERIKLLKSNKNDVDLLIDLLKTKVSKSIRRNKDFFLQYSDQIYIISSGFKEFILPIVAEYGILDSHVYANTFIFDTDHNIVGIDESNPLAADGGKIKVVKKLDFKGDVFVIGDGFTDYEIAASGEAEEFFAFIENVERAKVTANALNIIKSFDEFLYFYNLPRKQSFPKSKMKILLLENVHQDAITAFENDGFDVEVNTGAMSEATLLEKIKDVHILGIRSKTHISKEVLDNAPKLLCIGAFCIGTNQIDTKVALSKGIAVFNAPYSNTRSVVELVIGEMIILMRKVYLKSTKLHQGEWDKSSEYCYEIRGKKLGIIGYGHIGSQLSILGEALGMQVYYYDILDKMPLGNAKKCKSLEEVLKIADVVSIHVDGRNENTNLIEKNEFDLMKDGVVFLNLSRGQVVNVSDFVAAIKSNKVGGAGVDVFPTEPNSNTDPFVSELQGLDNVILTPHIGGSTEEAQAGIGQYIPERILEYINNGSTSGSVNLPELQLPILHDSHRILHLHRNVPGVLAKINSIFAKYKINIKGQFLKTQDEVGYVILDIDKTFDTDFITEFKEMEETIKFRMLY